MDTTDYSEEELEVIHDLICLQDMWSKASNVFHKEAIVSLAHGKLLTLPGPWEAIPEWLTDFLDAQGPQHESRPVSLQPAPRSITLGIMSLQPACLEPAPTLNPYLGTHLAFARPCSHQLGSRPASCPANPQPATHLPAPQPASIQPASLQPESRPASSQMISLHAYLLHASLHLPSCSSSLLPSASETQLSSTSETQLSIASEPSSVLPGAQSVDQSTLAPGLPSAAWLTPVPAPPRIFLSCSNLQWLSCSHLLFLLSGSYHQSLSYCNHLAQIYSQQFRSEPDQKYFIDPRVPELQQPAEPPKLQQPAVPSALQQSPELSVLQQSPELSVLQQSPELSVPQQRPDLCELQRPPDLSEPQRPPELSELQQFPDLPVSEVRHSPGLSELQQNLLSCSALLSLLRCS
ncbi:coagulation factor V-like isoform X2 [Siniperca chuatsi]|uniref:coagulation factor V-like isoform X2 n=1 Tax=Siniperca chuatsi TaxID=119488 RepID=UPI001CE18E04|nr:coagulation factor V-like isoform X2 [Siniperca chuatsi]XP_044078384.1 coagulation factor V-like isoform X2 [Siniperca chuatsi]XP_044078385.1 coagulation factor V-like isoform X2 [Siniperca chuatsi]XP_044078386.1 coagulation factor V-like isoform X2 [Siniperca chuatsi]XP_044078387.1 coagulation factor V-like isoform X2 [Siniperca chuatsi]XP_044078388.1 coagulation factor V-like isoform X2 [Siniperca chuatsi]